MDENISLISEGLAKIFNYMALSYCRNPSCHRIIKDNSDGIIIHKHGVEFRFCHEHAKDAEKILKWYGELVPFG